LAPVPGCGGCGGGTDYSATIEQITTLIEQGMQESEVTGLSIALVDGQDVVWAQGFGYADKENDIKATAETVYEIGSISKTITATAVMNAQDNGLLDIDDSLTQCLPEFSILPPLGFDSQADKPITIRTMMTHHSGIPGDLQNGSFTLEPRTDYNAWLLNYLRSEYACYPPNFVYAYSNTAVSLLAQVIAEVSGQSWEEYTDSLFETMGMHNTSYFLNKPSMKENLARGHLRDVLLEDCYDNMWAAGAVRSNVLDMAKYIKMINGNGQGEEGQVLRPETLEEMLTPQNEDIPLDFDFRQGLAWCLSDLGFDYAGRTCQHTGATIGFTSHVEIALDHQLGVVVLSNSNPEIAIHVVIDVAREALKLALKDKAGIEPVEPSGPTYSPYTTRPQEELEALAGVYVTEAGYDLISVVPGGLEWWMSYTGETQILLPLENGRFAPPESQEFQIEFSNISERDVMVWHGHGEMLYGLAAVTLWGDRYEPVPTPAVWSDRLGKYNITNLYPDDCTRFIPEEIGCVSLSIELTERDGMLVLEYTLQGKSPLLVLEPLNDTVALIHGVCKNRGGAVQIVTLDGQEQIQLWGSLYKR